MQKKEKKKNQADRVAIERTVSREPLYQLDKISEGNRAGNSCGSLKYLSGQPGCKQRSREKGWAVLAVLDEKVQRFQYCQENPARISFVQRKIPNDFESLPRKNF